MLEKGEGSEAFLKGKMVTTRYYLEHMLPEAMGLMPSAMGGSDLLYALDNEALIG